MAEYDSPETDSSASATRLRPKSLGSPEAGNIVNMYQMEGQTGKGRTFSEVELENQKPASDIAAAASSPSSNRQSKEGQLDFEEIAISPKMDMGATSFQRNEGDESPPFNENGSSPSYLDPSIECSLHDKNAPAINQANESQQKPRPHCSADGSGSSSMVVTPQQQHLETFGNSDAGETKRGSEASEIDDARSGLKIIRPEASVVEHRTATSKPTSVVMDVICPLNTGSADPASTILKSEDPAQDLGVTTNKTMSSPVQKSRMSLLPSALGFASSLLPLARTESTSSVSTMATEKSSSSHVTDNKADSHENKQQSSGSSDTSSIISTLSSKASLGSVPTSSGAGPSSWRSMATYLTSRGPAAPIQESLATPTPGKNQRAITRNLQDTGEETPSTSFLLHHVTSASAIADRRRSLELGGPQKLREGFERVKAEMVSAAKELREDEKRKRDSARSDVSVDLDVLGEGNDVGHSTAADVIKGETGQPHKFPLSADGIDWSSKSITLGATYSALLKLPSSHEKAIQKDLSRTFPNHAYFKKGKGVGQENLFNVVKAYSL
ncbi:hypothetical protein QFC19_001421 [Naganishia cerealis]|uniref:Uncharacterized protein n=1 Tax=Naganishia cerealis TaxID=610337 RepID=A0ACC2WK37_9TREE|nr:hypothetical protein QFC19_001421 [Naganishia cerealis]